MAEEVEGCALWLLPLPLRPKNEKWEVVRACVGGTAAVGGGGAGTEFCLVIVLGIAGCCCCCCC